MYKILKVQLKSGILSNFDSDTTLGIFCWRLKQILGEEKLKTFIDYYQKGNPVFTISNEFFEVKKTLFFPQPMFVPQKLDGKKNKTDKIGEMLNHKEIRNRRFISLRQLNAYLSGDLDDFHKQEPDIYADDKKKIELSPGYTSELRVSVEIDRASSKSKEGQLFSYHPKFLNESNKLAFLVKIFDQDLFDEYQCEKILKFVFRTGYGKKKSSGYGLCKVTEFKEFIEIKEPEDPNGFLILGNYLPAKNDTVIKGWYDTYVKYGRLGEELSLSSDPFKKPLLMIKPGGCFLSEKAKDFYGRVTDEGEISQANPFAVQFGIPFTLKVKFPETD